ncbi:hypothetical protein BA93_01310 [Finegoldia magna ALB8]|nr:hypothetical protein BA93_01310 [Finegoldia magna ALB8]
MVMNIGRQEVIDRLNPLIKIIILVSVTILVTFDKWAYLTLTLFALSIILVGMFSKITVLGYLYKLRYVLVLSISYGIFIFWGQTASGEGVNIRYSISLGLRFLVMAGYSIIFVNTVKPMELTMCLIKYFKVPESFGFAFLAAYRFFPTFKYELDNIKCCHATRGVASEGFFSVFVNIPKYTIPLLVTSIRKGERVAISMENKAFGKYENRTVYRPLKIEKLDIISILLVMTIIFIIVFIFNKYELFKFSLKY